MSVRRFWLLVMLVVALSAGSTATGCADSGTGGDATNGGTDEETTRTTDGETLPDGEETGSGTPIRVYFMRSSMDTSGFRNQELVAPVRRTTTETGVARAAILALLAGPTPAEMDAGFASGLPSGVKLLGVALDDGIATVDFSGAFASGGGSASVRARVAQVVFTLTQFQTVEAVLFRLDGEPLTELGGEGLVLEGSQDRRDWEDLSPEILIESPAFGDDFASPLTVTGTSNSFEGRFGLELKTGDTVLASRPDVAATSGTGTRGQFEATLRFDVAGSETAVLRAYNASPKDGAVYDAFTVTGRVR